MLVLNPCGPEMLERLGANLEGYSAAAWGGNIKSPRAWGGHPSMMDIAAAEGVSGGTGEARRRDGYVRDRANTHFMASVLK